MKICSAGIILATHIFPVSIEIVAILKLIGINLQLIFLESYRIFRISIEISCHTRQHNTIYCIPPHRAYNSFYTFGWLRSRFMETNHPSGYWTQISCVAVLNSNHYTTGPISLVDELRNLFVTMLPRKTVIVLSGELQRSCDVVINWKHFAPAISSV